MHLKERVYFTDHHVRIRKTKNLVIEMLMNIKISSNIRHQVLGINGSCLPKIMSPLVSDIFRHFNPCSSTSPNHPVRYEPVTLYMPAIFRHFSSFNSGG
jgi:hypothetical protein